MLIVYKGDNEFHNLKIGNRYKMYYRGHVQYCTPRELDDEGNLKSKDEKDFMVIKNFSDVDKLGIVKSKTNPKICFIIPMGKMELVKNLVFLLPSIRYVRECNPTATIDVIIPKEYHKLLYGYRVNVYTQDTKPKQVSYDDIYNLTNYEPQHHELRLYHMIIAYYAHLELDHDDSKNRGLLEPKIFYKANIEKIKPLTIGIDNGGGTTINSWDVSENHSKVTSIITNMIAKYREDLQIIQFDRKNVIEKIDELSICDVVISFGESIVTMLSGAMSIPSVAIIGSNVNRFSYQPLKSVRVIESDMKCRPCVYSHVGGACAGKRTCMENIPTTVVEKIVNDVIDGVVAPKGKNSIIDVDEISKNEYNNSVDSNVNKKLKGNSFKYGDKRKGNKAD